MSGWLRYFVLRAQASTGFSTPIVVWAVVAVVAAVVAAIFLLVAAYVWLSDAYDGLVAGLLLGGLFALIALIALVTAVLVRRRNMERARLELASRSSTSWLDPKLMAVGVQVGQAIGWRRIAALAAVAVLAAGVAQEWSGRKKSGDDSKDDDKDDEED
jgi:hypothetical protein